MVWHLVPSSEEMTGRDGTTIRSRQSPVNTVVETSSRNESILDIEVVNSFNRLYSKGRHSTVPSATVRVSVFISVILVLMEMYFVFFRRSYWRHWLMLALEPGTTGHILNISGICTANPEDVTDLRPKG